MGKGESTRRAIIDHALAHAREVGLEGVSLGVLASSLKLSKSGLFAHFKSKEALQLGVLEEAIARFAAQVVTPALAQPRGEPRVTALFERYLAWIRGDDEPGGCIFQALTHEYDDRPGALRDRLVASQRDWLATLSRAASLAVAEGHFRRDLDAAQFAFELVAIGMAFHQARRLLRDPRADSRAKKAYAALLARAKK